MLPNNKTSALELSYQSKPRVSSSPMKIWPFARSHEGGLEIEASPSSPAPADQDVTDELYYPVERASREASISGNEMSVQSSDIETALVSTSESDHSLLKQDSSELHALFYDDCFSCPVKGCSQVFTATAGYRRHRINIHKLPRFNCVQCSAPFFSYKDLSKHMDERMHSIMCTQCPLTFKRLGDASCHYGQRHRLLTCPTCNVRIQGRVLYKSHQEMYHSAGHNSYDEALAFVETTLNSSCRESADEDDDLESLETSKSVLQVQPDSTNSYLDFDAVDSSCIVNYSDTDTAETELASDVDTGTEDVASYGGLPPSPEEPQFLCPIVFGPGAHDLLHDELNASPSYLSSTINEQNTNWIGHDVDMYQSLQEKHKETFRFVCSKCSCTFKSKEVLKRHARVHEHVCKHCFLKFDSLLEYRIHLKTHVKTFICSVCNHSTQGLKSLMIHEMRHRLNSSFRRKIEDVAIVSQTDEFDCDVCGEKFSSLSPYIRHETWHNWSRLWTSYVVGRIFQGTFTEAEANKHKQYVEDELKCKWRDCSKVNDLGKQSDKPEQCPKISSDTLAETETEEGDSENENGESDHPALNSWMNYWRSYLGVGPSPPSWVLPILKKLRSEWKGYHEDGHVELYRKMDQIAVLLRSQNNEALLSEGPRVVIQRLSPSVLHKVHKSRVVLKKLASAPAPLKIQIPKVVIEKLPSAQKVQEGKVFAVKSPTVDAHKLLECRANADDLPTDNCAQNVLKCRVVVEKLPNSHTRFSLNKTTEAKDLVNLAKDVNDVPARPQDPLKVSQAVRQPLVLLTRLISPPSDEGIPRKKRKVSPVDIQGTPSTQLSQYKHPSPTLGLTLSASTTPRKKFQPLEWLKDGCEHIPEWALKLVEDVYRRRSLTQAQKVDKIHQIKNLLKVASGQSALLTPVVMLNPLKISVEV